jgi:hypothetical protein
MIKRVAKKNSMIKRAQSHRIPPPTTIIRKKPPPPGTCLHTSLSDGLWISISPSLLTAQLHLCPVGLTKKAQHGRTKSPALPSDGPFRRPPSHPRFPLHHPSPSLPLEVAVANTTPTPRRIYSIPSWTGTSFFSAALLSDPRMLLDPFLSPLATR